MPGAPPADRLRKAPPGIPIAGICLKCKRAVRPGQTGSSREVLAWEPQGRHASGVRFKTYTGRVLCPGCTAVGPDPDAAPTGQLPF